MHKINYLRLSITDQCDMRCRHCIPYRTSFRETAPLSLDEVCSLIRAFDQNGITKVRLTGGEPLERPGVLHIIESLKRTPGIAEIGLTTNGLLLEDFAKDLVAAGVGAINVSLDSLDPETFRRITGRDALSRVLRGIDVALRSEFDRVKINTVVMRGVNDSEIPAFADFAKDLPVDVRFIELMPLGHAQADWRSIYVPAVETTESFANADPLPDPAGSSARMYSIAGGQGRLGVISAMSEDFCEGCNRIRVTSSGKLKPCLRLPVEQDIRPLLSEPDLAAQLASIINSLSVHKLSCAPPETSVQAETMCSIGG